jgi:hypothetical protein
MGGRSGDEGVVVMVVGHEWEGEGLRGPSLLHGCWWLGRLLCAAVVVVGVNRLGDRLGGNGIWWSELPGSGRTAGWLCGCQVMNGTAIGKQRHIGVARHLSADTMSGPLMALLLLFYLLCCAQAFFCCVLRPVLVPGLL